MVALTATPAAAANVIVMNTNDSGLGSLREAINLANADPNSSTITFDPGVVGTIVLTSDLPTISESVTITGPGAGTLAINGDGNIVFLISGAINVEVTGLVIDNAGSNSGFAGIESNNAILTLDDVIVTQSYAGLDVQGGMATVTNSDFNANTESGIVAEVGSGTVTLTNVNTSGNGEAGLEGYLYGTAELEATNVNGNGNSSYGTVLAVSESAEVSFTNTQNSGNGTASFYEGIYAQFVDDSRGTFINTAAHGNGFHGIAVNLDNRSIVTFDSTQANGNLGCGVYAEAYRHASLTLTGTETHGNQCAGVYVGAFTGAEISVADLNSNGNADAGIAIEARGSGGINNGPSSITAHNVAVQGSDNGAYVDVSHGANATITDSDFRNNSSHGVFIDSDGENGTDSFVRIDATTIMMNGSNPANGGGVGIVRTHDLDVTISDTTIAYNNANEGGGIYARLAGTDPTQLTIVNSTIVNNTAEIGGAAYLRSNFSAPVSILNSTFMNNITTDNNPSTASLYLQGTNVDVRNTIVALSLALDVDFDANALVSFDYSLIQTSSASAALALLAGTGNITGVDPELGALADNGGPNWTMLPNDGSPVINAGEPAFAALSDDQRGEARVSGGRLDIGAAEVQQGLAATGSVDVTATLAGGILLSLAGLVLLAARGARKRVA